MSAAPPPILLLDALADPAALLELGTLRVMHANRALLERAPDAVDALPPFAWWPGDAADAVAGEIVAAEGGPSMRLAVFRESGAALDRVLRHVATAVAGNVEPAEVFALVSGAARELLDADSAAVVRYEGPTHGRVMGQSGIAMPNRRFTLLGENTAAVTARTGRPSHVRDFAALDGDVPQRLVAMGQRSGIAVPVHVDGRLWGALVAGDHRPGHIAGTAIPPLAEFAGLIGLMLAEADARTRLEQLATADPLTGLINHRSFQERVSALVGDAAARGTELALAYLDIDGFKTVNETRGHLVGDRVLEVVAGCLEDVVGAAGTAARIGGDEFAVLLPGMTDREAALLIELVRSEVAGGTAAIEARVTISAGICAVSSARDAEVLRSLADGALYWAKAHGRDRCVRYDPAIVEELSAAERAQRLERDRALSGLRALAAAVDARDPSTLRHSERVSALAERIAVELGWEPRRLRRLRDAALLHDVGKLAIPDAVLFKPGRLDAAEYEQVKAHSGLGAQIVRDLLDDEQVGWVRSHHERPDGRGYPDGLGAGAISDGAAILAVADAYDAMTVARPYSAPLPPAEALEECRRLAGAQFDPGAVRALEAVLALGSGSATRAAGARGAPEARR
jgi:diguanylate cyclase (GGDEF)-like protein/putative nucleotidyltransferase with HDIG domain